MVQVRVPTPMLLADRFLPGSGAVEVLGLALYAAVLTRWMLNPKQTNLWRIRLWRFFSVVFFLQLFLGVLGISECLMTGTLHFPIPALIIAGPLYRGSGLFMPILLSSTLILVGPAWCSHLCYIGAWDDLAARRKRLPRKLPRWRNGLRLAILIVFVAVPVLLRETGVEGGNIVPYVIGFGAASLLVMAVASTRTGAMAHCSSWCPIGLVTTTLGRVSPFRVLVGNGCTTCGACYTVCRYDALSADHIARGKVGANCTLCGECLPACGHGALKMAFGPLRGADRKSVV